MEFCICYCKDYINNNNKKQSPPKPEDRYVQEDKMQNLAMKCSEAVLNTVVSRLGTQLENSGGGFAPNW